MVSGKSVVGPKAGPIEPGDEVLLMSGNYGAITVGQYLAPIVNPSFVTIAAAPGQTPVLTTLGVSASKMFAFNRLKVQSTQSNGAWLIAVKDQGANYPTSDIVFEDMTLSSQNDVSGWDQAQWIANASSGFLVGPTLYTSCVSMTGSHINNVKTPAGLFASNLVFSGNQLDHFGDDGIDYGASYLTITKNYIHDNLNIGDGNHEDAMQGYAAKLPAGVTVADYEHILIDSNTIIRQTDAHLQFPTYLQGIDAFDQEWSQVTVTNNVVITSACWGIVFSSIHNSTIANNTAVSDGLIVVPCVPAVGVGDKTHQGDSSSNTVVRNNLANEIFVDNLDPGVEMDHNVGMTP